MSYFRKGDPLDDFELQDIEQARYEARLPKCECCGKTIWEHYFEINNEILCENCTIDQYRHSVEDFAEID
jgi:formylmethanofuran dehydrogenase subunit E